MVFALVSMICGAKTVLRTCRAAVTSALVDLQDCHPREIGRPSRRAGEQSSDVGAGEGNGGDADAGDQADQQAVLDQRSALLLLAGEEGLGPAVDLQHGFCSFEDALWGKNGSTQIPRGSHQCTARSP